jgi:methionine synthase I (cobalamin-dependent)
VAIGQLAQIHSECAGEVSPVVISFTVETHGQLSSGEPLGEAIDEVDRATDLDEGDPAELGRQYRELRTSPTRLRLLGGCCGTDHRRVDAIFRACRSG